jgi:UPF0716 family protein affecting phage T7 exclusion
MKLFEKTGGKSWLNHTNWNFSNFTAFNPCLQPWYGLTVQCNGNTQGGTSGVTQLLLSSNQLSGELPSPLSSFLLLQKIAVDFNHLHGSLPFLKGLPLLKEFDVGFNDFDTRIADDLFDSVSYQNLVTLRLQYNGFTGTLPVWLYHSVNLAYLYVNNNLFEGTVSSQIGKLPLAILWLGPNSFEGSILSSFTSSTSLLYLSIRENYFHEPFPLTFDSSKRMLMSLDATKNQLTGSLPTWFCNKGFLSLTQLLVPYNHLTGTLPICFANNLQKFSTIFLNNNHLSGSLTTIFQNPANFGSLSTLTLGFNSFSGSFPMKLFQFPKLTLLSAMVNCFDGSLDESICNEPSKLSTSIGLINLDGLNAASSCIHKIGVFPSYYTNRMIGSLPWCLWGELPNLQVMYLAGNGFQGTIPVTFNEKSKMNMLSLSHNYFTGTIPISMQKTEFLALDLSYNQFTGNIQGITNISLASSSRGYFNLSNNRLSGSLSSTFSSPSINILYDNVFECNANLPVNDPNYGNYFCGSSSLDNATYSFIVVIVGLIMAFGYYFKRFLKVNFASDFIFSCQSFFDVFQVFLSTVMYSNGAIDHMSNDVIAEEKKKHIRHVFWTFDKIISLNVYLSGCFLFFLLPVYLILNSLSPSIRKYQYEYSWIHTASYLTGVFPSIFLLIFWFFLILFFESYIILTQNLEKKTTTMTKTTVLTKAKTLLLNFLGEGTITNRILYRPLVDNIVSINDEIPSVGEYDETDPLQCPSSAASSSFSTSLESDNSNSNRSSFFLYYLSCFSLVLMDIVITVVVNVFYLLSLDKNSDSRNEVIIQLGMALFKLGWNSIIVTSILSALKFFFSSTFHLNTHHLRVFLLVFNVVLSPCFAAIVYDGSCFHDLFFGTPNLTPVSVFSDITSPKEFSIYTESSFQLPWMYYYTCGSHILMSYIPVFLYSYSILPMKLLLEIMIITKMKGSFFIDYCPTFIKNAIPGILRKNDYHLFPRMFRSDSIIANLILHCSILCSFGFASPLLGFLITVVMIFECVVWKIMIITFLYHGKTKEKTKSSSPMSSEEEEYEEEEDNGDRPLENVLLLLQPPQSQHPRSHEASDIVKRFETLNSSLQSNEWLLFYHAKWRIFYVSLFFMTLLLFDFVGDEQGFLMAIWVPIAFISFGIIIRVFLTSFLLKLQRLLVNNDHGDANEVEESSDRPRSIPVRVLGSLSGNNGL